MNLTLFEELPETHAWPSSDLNDPFSGDNSNSETIPIIDLSDENATELIGHACKTWGVFQVINHNISKNLIDEIELAGDRLFSLPMEQKLRVARPAGGLSGYGVARISPFFPKLMWNEGFTIVGSPVEHATQLWPNEYHWFCDIIEEYKREMKALADQLIWLMLRPLGITESDIKWANTEPEATLQLNSYPPCPDPDRAMGLAAHTDSTILTILHQSNITGLQVLRKGSTQWITVPPHPEALVVNLGDLMHILSNGLYSSVLHRAVVNRTRRRLSVAYLQGPPSGVEIGPLEKLVNDFRPPLYRPVTWSEYLEIKGKHFDKALAVIRISG